MKSQDRVFIVIPLVTISAMILEAFIPNVFYSWIYPIIMLPTGVFGIFVLLRVEHNRSKSRQNRRDV